MRIFQHQPKVGIGLVLRQRCPPPFPISPPMTCTSPRGGQMCCGRGSDERSPQEGNDDAFCLCCRPDGLYVTDVAADGACHRLPWRPASAARACFVLKNAPNVPHNYRACGARRRVCRRLHPQSGQPSCCGLHGGCEKEHPWQARERGVGGICAGGDDVPSVLDEGTNLPGRRKKLPLWERTCGCHWP